METLVEVKVPELVARNLYCDICNAPLYYKEESNILRAEKMVTWFWENDDELYLEKYICMKCFNKYFSEEEFEIFNFYYFDQAPKKYKSAIIKDLQRQWHSIVVSCTPDEFRKILENPTLLDKVGVKI